jgi:4-diphosphocytidyl-2-C-methyl-D-erythritol kinase
MPVFVLQSPSKINLTLRVLDRRDDGYHSIVSTFFRLPSRETLTIRPVYDDSSGKDSLRIHGESLSGRNILLDILSMARTKGLPVPRLVMDLWKLFPPGTGFAAGSGNAAVLLQWIEKTWDLAFHTDELATLGADVAFLHDREAISIRGGIGEIILDDEVPMKKTFSILLVIPDFSSDTATAYADLDKERKQKAAFSQNDAVCEARSILQSLEENERVGLLPNDFADVLLDRFPSYERFFEIFDSCKAVCWGITGSGSGCFAFFEGQRAACNTAWLLGQSPGVRKLSVLE